MCFQNNNSCLWLIIILLLIFCCCGNEHGSDSCDSGESCCSC